jgi:signal transduction histidine kinase/DNA-binding response OmpR family regulator
VSRVTEGINILSALDMVALERLGEGCFRLVGQPPEWCSKYCHSDHGSEVRPGEQFEFLNHFLTDAEAFWSANKSGRLKSGAWVETVPRGEELHLEASAVSLGDSKLLVIELLKFGFEEVRSLAQKARERRLAYDQLARAEEALRKSEAKNLAILDAIPDIMLHLDQHGVVLDYRARENMAIVLSPEDLKGRSAYDFLPSEIAEPLRKSIAGFAKAGTAQLVDCRILGTVPRDYEIRVVRSGSGEALAIIRDVTRRKQLERDLIEAREVAVKASEAKSAFLANMSHEIRTPMNAIVGMTELLLGSELNARQRLFVETVRLSADSLLALINDILDLSKIEAGKLSFEKIDFDLQKVISGAVELLRQRARTKGLELRFGLDPNVWMTLEGDPNRLRQVLVNLIGNAIKFTERGQVSLLITTESEDRSTVVLRFRVKDSGVGIPPDAIGKLFRPFSQADESTTRRYGGTGLGLAISKQLVEMMGGQIGVKSELGRGSEFWFTAAFGKRESAMADGSAASSGDAVPQPAGGGSRKPLRVLVVEDNPINQQVILAQLETLGHSAYVVGNGLEALDRLSTETYDVILMDCQMPELDGYEATRRLRRYESASRRNVVIAMTAAALEGEREKCLEAGMDDYVSKPVTLGTLDAVLQQWSSRAETAVPQEGPILNPRIISELRGLKSATNNLLAQVIDLFVAETPERIRLVRESLESGDGVAVARAAHSLKSGSSILGVRRLVRLCDEIEELANSGRMNEVTPFVEALQSEYELARTALEKERSSAAAKSA